MMFLLQAYPCLRSPIVALSQSPDTTCKLHPRSLDTFSQYRQTQGGFPKALQYRNLRITKRAFSSSPHRRHWIVRNGILIPRRSDEVLEVWRGRRQVLRGLRGQALEELLAETLWRRMDLVSVEQVMFWVVRAEMLVLKE